MRALYVHLPFCPYLCPYCDFAKWPYRRSAAQQYLLALYAEAAAAADTERYETVFLGGGTPNTYAASDIAALLARLRETFPGPADRETTIEVNPELVRAEDLGIYARAGINRISIGVQSFVPTEIRALGRKHDAGDVARAVSEVRAAGIRSVSVDLMFAVPGQSEPSWTESLDRAIQLGVDHVSAYGLTVEPDTPYERWRERDPQAFPDEALEARMYDAAIATLERNGYEQYEISNFARPGHRCMHNANYWANGEYRGLGVGAASYIAGVRSIHTRDRRAYVAAALDGRRIPGESEELRGGKRAGEAVMLALRTSQGVSFGDFKERYGLEFLKYYAPVVERYRSDGLLEIDGTGARLTRRGRFLANDVCGAFVTFE